MRIGAQWLATALLAAGADSPAAEPPTPAHRPPSPRQQLVACMTKEMSASRTISYLEAQSVCKMRIQSEAARLASGATDKSAGGGRGR